MKNVPWQIEKIISVANELSSTGKTGASTGEVIAAAFVLNRMELLPNGYSALEAWQRLDEPWQDYVKQILEDYSDLLVPW